MNVVFTYSGDILNNLLSFLLVYKYVALFIITYISAAGIPVPSTSVVIASAAFSSQGYFNLGLVILIAELGNVAGDNTAYWITRLYGRRVIEKFKLLRWIFDLKQIGQVEDILKNKTSATLLISRFMSQVGPVVDLLSGLTKLNYRKYLTLVIIGELIQVSVFASVGYFLGNNWQNSIGTIASITGLIALFVFLYVIKKVFFGKSKIV